MYIFLLQSWYLSDALWDLWDGFICSRDATNSSNVPCNGLDLNRQRAIIRPNDGIIYWRIYALLGSGEPGRQRYIPSIKCWQKMTACHLFVHNISYWSVVGICQGCQLSPLILPEGPHERNTSSWWRHQMETFSALLAIYAGNSPVSGEFPAQRPATRCFDVFFDQRPNKRLSKQSWSWWFETHSPPLWRHSNA